MVSFQEKYLDLVLVPGGLVIMFSYNVFLLYKHHTDPQSTVIGLENQDKKEWVASVVKQPEKAAYDRAVSVISSNTQTALYLATISLTLFSLIGTWLSSNTSSSMLHSQKIYGDTTPFTIFIKNICLLACLLLAFSGFVQSVRHLVHSNYLISSPESQMLLKKIQFAITRGNDFWSFGLRALYFALNVLLWYFGPIPMFVSSILMVMVLYYHDIYTVKLHNSYCYSDHYLKPKATMDRGGFSY